MVSFQLGSNRASQAKQGTMRQMAHGWWAGSCGLLLQRLCHHRS